MTLTYQLIEPAPRPLDADWHAPACSCPCCVPAAPVQPKLRHSANSVARLMISGAGAGLAIGAVIDRLTAGPGLLAVLGWS